MDPDYDSTSELDAATDAGKKDARPGVDSSSTGDTPDGSSDDSDSSPGDDGDDASTDAGDADAGDGGKTDAGSDAGVDPGIDAGDAGGSTATKPLPGEVVISEVMYNPSGDETVQEWIEIHNTAATPRLLSGLVLKDGASPVHSHTIGPGISIAPGAYVVLARKTSGAMAAKVPTEVIVYDYGAGTLVANQVQLGNSGSGAILLFDGTTEIAQARYGKLGLGNAADGQSIQLKTLTYAGAGIAGSWCKSSNPWTAGSDKGTPGAPSDCQ